MSVFTDPPSFSAGRFTQAQGNTYVRDNLLALKYPPTAIYETTGRTSDYTTTSTSFVDVDATNMALSITTAGDGAAGASDVLIGFCGGIYSSASIRIYFRLVEDGATLNVDGDGLCVSEGSGRRPMSFDFLRANATIGTHVYKLQWKVSSGTGTLLANVGTSGFDCRSIFFAREFS